MRRKINIHKLDKEKTFFIQFASDVSSDSFSNMFCYICVVMFCSCSKLWIEQHTEEALRRMLVDNDCLIIMNDEMLAFNASMKKRDDSGALRALYLKLYDGGTQRSSTQTHGTVESAGSTHVCMVAFGQFDSLYRIMAPEQFVCDGYWPRWLFGVAATRESDGEGIKKLDENVATVSEKRERKK